MAPAKTATGGFEKALRAAALQLPDVEEGVACEGTLLESRTFKVRKKAFLFVRPANVMLKLAESADEARRLASTDARFRVGGGGWVTVIPGGGAPPPLPMMKRWIGESYRLYAAAATIAPTRKRTATRK
jgi:hypothetical protein